MVGFGDVGFLEGMGFSTAAMGRVAIVFVIIILAVIMVGATIFVIMRSKKFYITIELYKLIDNETKLKKKYKACEHKIGKAGDILWFVSGANKYLLPGTIQSGPNTYKYFERSDGEWVNFRIGNVDEQMRLAGVKYIDNDMRAQRIAIGKSLDSELQEQTWWQKYGATITFILEILVFGIACVIIFYMFGGVVEQMDSVVGSMNRLVNHMNDLFGNFTKEIPPYLGGH